MSKRVLRILVPVTCLCWLYATQVSFAWTGTIPEQTSRQISLGVSHWKYVSSNTPGVGALVTTGSRKDTKRVARTIFHIISGNKRNVNLNIEKRTILRYEVYAKGPRKGELYRFYQPSATTITKSCRYLKAFRLTTSVKTSLLDYGLNAHGQGSAHFAERIAFTLPRQFPMRNDGLTYLLRSAFKIDFGNQLITYSVIPNGKFGRVSVSY